MYLFRHVSDLQQDVVEKPLWTRVKRMLRAGVQATVIGKVAWYCERCRITVRGKVDLVTSKVRCPECEARYIVRCDVVRDTPWKVQPTTGEIALDSAPAYELREYIKENAERWKREYNPLAPDDTGPVSG